MTAKVFGKVVLQLQRVVEEQIVRSEGLKTESGVCETSFLYVDHWEELALGLATLVLTGVAKDEAVRHRAAAESRIPLPDSRFDVLQHAVIRVREIQSVGVSSPVAENAERVRVRHQNV